MTSGSSKREILQLIVIGCFAGFPHFVYSSYNIAQGKRASQSSVYGGWGADKAVDGVIGKDVVGGSCSSTHLERSSTAWWIVDLQQMSRIKAINITYRQDYPFRLSGFYLYVSNMTVLDSLRSTWHLCFHDDTKDPELPSFNQSRCCPVDGRYVIFYNMRPADNGPKSHRYYSTTNAVVELCEVQVFGCPVNRFGSTCSGICHCGVGGCEVQVFGCPVNSFGPTCSGTCHCSVSGCDPDTGLCDVNGCQSGWMGLTCSEECESGKFGMNCSHTCHCLQPGCDRETGSCMVPGCEAGWQGSACDQKCGTGNFGDKCLQACHCALPGCDQFNGSCTQPGCEPGWTGMACDKVCLTGYFGVDCKQTCHCDAPGCNRTNGVCISSGCEAGWEGLSCDKACDIGKYGKDCKYTCNCATPGCDMTSGNCIVSGCALGWQGPTCNRSCNISSFGSNCDTICHCTKPGCDRFTGLCNVAGCDVGWTGSACDQGVNINSKDNSMKSGSNALVGYALLGSLLFISIGFNIGFIIDRLRTKRKKSERTQSHNEMHYQNTVNVNENYEILDTSKVERTKNIYDTVDKKCG